MSCNNNKTTDCGLPLVGGIRPTFMNLIPLTFDNTLSYYEQLCAFAKKVDEIIGVVNAQSLTISDVINEIYEIINEFKADFVDEDEFNEFKTEITNYIDGKYEYLLELINSITTEGIGETIATGTVYNVGGVDYTAGDNAEIFNSYDGGVKNKAAGSYSHAEGSANAALATGSHVEGLNNIAIGNGSHAEGTGNNANGQGAHVEGAVNIASGANSHCGGTNSTASGAGAFVHGNGCTANTAYQTVIGKYNNSTVNHAFVIGNGADAYSKHNAFSIDDTGKVYVNGSTNGIDISTMIVPITQTDYDNLSVKNPTTLYVIIPEGE